MSARCFTRLAPFRFAILSASFPCAFRPKIILVVKIDISVNSDVHFKYLPIFIPLVAVQVQLPPHEREKNKTSKITMITIMTKTHSRRIFLTSNVRECVESVVSFRISQKTRRVLFFYVIFFFFFYNHTKPLDSRKVFTPEHASFGDH